MQDFSDQVIDFLSQSILLDISAECREGVKQNTQILHQYSELIHQFQIPEIE